MTTAMNFDPTLHAEAIAAETGGQSAASTVKPAGKVVAATAQTKSGGGKLQAFEGFLKRAGQTAGVVLSDLVKYVVPLAQVSALADPEISPAVAAFTTAVHLVQTTVLSTQQRWANDGAAANTQKLADVLTVVEQPILLLFAQAGLHVDTDYVVNLVNGVVAILNAQPAVSLSGSGTAGAVTAGAA